VEKPTLKDHLCPHPLSDYYPEDEDSDYLRNVVLSALKHLTLPIAREHLVIED